MIFPEGNVIAEGNILPNPPSGGSINDILYRKICHRKNSTTWTLWLNYLIKTAYLWDFAHPPLSQKMFSGHFLLLSWCFLSVVHLIFVGFLRRFRALCSPPSPPFWLKQHEIFPPFCWSRACCLAWLTRIMFHPMFPGEHGVEHCQKERRLAKWWRRLDIVFNFMLTCHKLGFLIEQFEIEV